jgi:DNA-binding MltR family transcriptional regulator
MTKDDQKPPSPDDAPSLDPIIHEMHSQNERGCAITGGVFLEEKLKEAIEKQWPKISKTLRNELFTGFGPLATFSAKIKLAKAMGVLSVSAKADCDKIRLIRNEAAHIGTPFSFNDAKIAKRIDTIECMRQFPPDIASDSDRRNRFTAAIKYLTSYLFLQVEWKRRFGHKTVMPDLYKAPDKRRTTNSSSDSNSGS